MKQKKKLKTLLQLLLICFAYTRVAIIVLNYNHLCKGKSFSTGPEGLRERLLTQSGYRVVTVKHTEFDPKADLVKNVQYLQNLINNAMAAARN